MPDRATRVRPAASARAIHPAHDTTAAHPELPASHGRQQARPHERQDLTTPYIHARHALNEAYGRIARGRASEAIACVVGIGAESATVLATHGCVSVRGAYHAAPVPPDLLHRVIEEERQHQAHQDHTAPAGPLLGRWLVQFEDDLDDVRAAMRDGRVGLVLETYRRIAGRVAACLAAFGGDDMVPRARQAASTTQADTDAPESQPPQ